MGVIFWKKEECFWLQRSSIQIPSCNFDYAIFLTVKYLDETLLCDHSKETYGAVLSRASFCYTFALVLAWNTLQRTVMCDLSKKQYNRQYFHVLPLVDQYNLC